MINPYVIIFILVAWAGSLVGAFKYGQHVREVEIQSAASADNVAAQTRADAAAVQLQQQWEHDRVSGAALDGEVNSYAQNDSARTDCFDAAGLQLFNAIATGVPVSSARPAAVPTDPPGGQGRQPGRSPTGR